MDKETAPTKIAIFRKREIRKTIHKNEWWFVVVDVVGTEQCSVPTEHCSVPTQRPHA